MVLNVVTGQDNEIVFWCGGYVIMLYVKNILNLTQLCEESE